MIFDPPAGGTVAEAFSKAIQLARTDTVTFKVTGIEIEIEEGDNDSAVLATMIQMIHDARDEAREQKEMDQARIARLTRQLEGVNAAIAALGERVVEER